MPDSILGTGAKSINKIEFDILWMSSYNSEDRLLPKRVHYKVVIGNNMRKQKEL